MTAGAAIAAVMPEGAIVMDEAATTGLPFLGRRRRLRLRIRIFR